MQLTPILIGALFASGLHAAPAAGAGQSAIDGNVIFKRSGQLCRVLADEVNCRTGPGTNYKSIVRISNSWTRGYYFTCVKSGQCITLNGAVNCGWDYLEEEGCYVNGHYTDGSCTLAKLGRC
ncbi:uncharacterized protein N7515_001563 [Penicillium bovifimosum]|uniref:Uncharacterized protein n=1 Tax=Penicillium bovifimosum TaxID=126998 RepID=A0A9W9HBP8_9EURO|nr:uncharacterized protein N7515_001563 [Penicillium bovifimosum]KAJ5142776.1 hypothetical protein N7515_001563 [Penicillium bovifimosum]